jgi:hypothetical protein
MTSAYYLKLYPIIMISIKMHFSEVRAVYVGQSGAIYLLHYISDIYLLYSVNLLHRKRH